MNTFPIERFDSPCPLVQQNENQSVNGNGADSDSLRVQSELSAAFRHGPARRDDAVGGLAPELVGVFGGWVGQSAVLSSSLVCILREWLLWHACPKERYRSDVLDAPRRHAGQVHLGNGLFDDFLIGSCSSSFAACLMAWLRLALKLCCRYASCPSCSLDALGFQDAEWVLRS